MKACPYCFEDIQDDAIYCRYCHRDVNIIDHTQPKNNRLPAMVWGLVIGLLVALLTITQRFDNLAEIIDISSLPGMEGLTSVYINSMILGSIINFFIWTTLTTIVLSIFRSIFKDTAEIWVLAYSAVSLAIIMLGIAYFYGVTTFSKTAAQSSTAHTPLIVENTPVFSLSTPVPQYQTHFPDPMPGSRVFGDQNSSWADQSDFDYYEDFFGVRKIQGFEETNMQMGKTLPPFREWAEYIEGEMNKNTFVLQETGSNYLIFFSHPKMLYIGFIYDVSVDNKFYGAAQWGTE